MLNGLISGSDGKTSTMRFTTVFTALVLLGVYIAHNVIAMIGGLGIIGFTVTDAGLLAAILGVKALQSFAECSNNPVEGEKKSEPCYTKDPEDIILPLPKEGQ